MNSIKYDRILYPVREVRDFKDMIVKSTELYGDKAAYLQKDKPGGTFCPITFRRFKDEMDALGTRFIDMGLKGKKIAVIGETCYQWILTYFATVCGVGVIVPLDKNLPPEELRSLIRRSGATTLVYTARFEKNMKSLFENSDAIENFISIGKEEHGDGALSFYRLIDEGQELLRQGIRDYVDAEIDPDELATLMFTSGTTGLAKGVMLSHKNIVNNVYQMSKYVKIPEGAVVLSILPVHHSYEFTCSICTTFYQGKTIAICEGIKYIQKNMNEVSADIMLGVPLVFEKMYKGMWKQAERQGEAEKLRKAIDLSRKMKLYNNRKLIKKLFKAIHQSFGNNMGLFIAGGAAIDPKVIEDFEAMGLPMIQGYGMSEHAPIIAVNQDRYSKAASVGRPLPGTEVRISDPDEDGVGEIVCKSDSVMLGYYDDPRATEEVLADGWLHTGDLGYFDQDGFLYISGRKKTVIVTKGGKNIYPEEVETVFTGNELIEEILVYGKADEKVGNVIITADIFPNYPKLKELYGEMSSSEIYRFYKDLVDETNKKMPPYKAVKRISVRDKEFAKTTTGKIKRYGNDMENAPAGGGQEYAAGDASLRSAKLFLKSLFESSSRFIKYRDVRPISDLKHMFETGAGLYGDRTAFSLKSGKDGAHAAITYKEAYADVSGLGTALMDRIEKGAKIALMGGNSYGWAAAFLAAACGAGIATPLDKDIDRDEAEKILRDAEVSCVFFDGKYEDIFKEIKEAGNTGLKWLVSFDRNESSEDVLSWKELAEEGKHQIGLGNRQFVDAKTDPEGACVLLYTGGAESPGKGIMLSHKNLTRGLMSLATVIGITPGDVFVSVLPAHYAAEIMYGFLFPLYRGASIIFCDGMKYMARNTEDPRPTAIVCVPALAEAFYKQIRQRARALGKERALMFLAKINRRFGIDAVKTLRDALAGFGGGIRMIIAGRGSMSTDILQFFKGIGVLTIPAYDLGECSAVAAITPDSPEEIRTGSVGRLLPGMEARIAGSDNPVIGEIYLKGENITRGYYKNPEATERILRDGWLRTGNMGFVDSDGFIYITGNVKTVDPAGSN